VSVVFRFAQKICVAKSGDCVLQVGFVDSCARLGLRCGCYCAPFSRDPVGSVSEEA
jgi:hypothetical protein